MMQYKTKPSVTRIMNLLSPIIWLLYIELLNGWTLPKLFRYWFSGEVDWFILAFHGFGFLLLCGLFFVLRRLLGERIGHITAATISAIFGITNFCVLSITGQPFVFSDLKIAGTAFSVLSSQSLSKGGVLTLTCAVLCWLGYSVTVWLMTAKQVYEAKQYLLRLVPAVLAANLMYFGVLVSADLADVVLLFDGHHKYGAIAHFVISGGVGLDFPEDVEQYLPQKDIDTISDFKPNIIIIMNEAFSDLHKTFHLESNMDAIPFFHQLCEKYPHGISYSSVRGNNTCSTEFELLSGVSTALTAKGATIYESNAVPMQTLVSAMNARGYETVGIHPYYSTGYNREAVYEALGFDKSLFMDDFENAEYIHGFISDKSNYEKLIDCYETADKPFFCFNVTMQNHAGYDDDSDLPDKVTAKTNSDAGDALNNYLTLLHESDKALKYLISYFESVEEPTVILFVGDHQPMLGKSFYEEQIGKLLDEFSVEDVSRMYEVPYLIWANFSLNMECVPTETSMNYLQDILFETAGIVKTSWMEMLSEYRLEYPIVTSNFMRQGEGAFIPLSVSDTLAEYQKYCYGILWGGG